MGEPTFVTVLRWFASIPGWIVIIYAIVSGIQAFSNPPEKRTYTSVKGVPVRTDDSSCIFTLTVGSWIAYVGFKAVGWIYALFT